MKGVYSLRFLANRNLGTFDNAVKDQAIVDAPWVRLCMSCLYRDIRVGRIAYSYIAGSFTIARSTAMVS